MNQPSLLLNYPSPAQTLANQIAFGVQALSSELPSRIPQPLPVQLRLTETPPSLHRLQPPGRVWATAIALQLAQQIGMPAPDLAKAIVSHCTDAVTDPQISMVASEDGWLYGFAPETSLAIWLTRLYDLHCRNTLLTLGPVGLPCLSHSSPIGQQLEFDCHYAHARCCSLLRLGTQESLFGDQPIPWLSPQKCLWLQHPSEQALLDLLLQFPISLSANYGCWGQAHETPDTFPSHDHLIAQPATPQQLLAVCRRWANGFEQFYRHCQIFSEVKTQQPELTQSRLGLVAILKSGFGFLIEQVLGEQPRGEL